MVDGNQLLKNQAGQLHGEIRTGAIATVSGGPTLLELPEGPLSGRKDFLVYNGTDQTLFVGGSAVVAASGIPIAVGGSWAAQLGRAKLWATVSGTDASGALIQEIS